MPSDNDYILVVPVLVEQCFPQILMPLKLQYVYMNLSLFGNRVFEDLLVR